MVRRVLIIIDKKKYLDDVSTEGTLGVHPRVLKVLHINSIRTCAHAFSDLFVKRKKLFIILLQLI